MRDYDYVPKREDIEELQNHTSASVTLCARALNLNKGEIEDAKKWLTNYKALKKERNDEKL
jgi:translation elongation factor EF-Ts